MPITFVYISSYNLAIGVRNHKPNNNTMFLIWAIDMREEQELYMGRKKKEKKKDIGYTRLSFPKLEEDVPYALHTKRLVLMF